MNYLKMMEGVIRKLAKLPILLFGKANTYKFYLAKINHENKRLYSCKQV